MTRPVDTSATCQTRIEGRFESMTTKQRAAVLSDLNDTCTKMAIAGIRHAHGELEPNELRWHLAARRYGESLADNVYGPRQE